ncbi:hypothetical protein [Photobacterium leiognathi]|uniref:hypothetical protein n=1 Tax=Photobacterium leiognathi TaxID=553611 RepID=UPI0029829DFE|nr:hypothetical protein [Photobacterium leiognathi]
MKRLKGLRIEHIAACLSVHSLRDIPQENRDAVLWAASNGQSNINAAAYGQLSPKTIARTAKKVLETHNIIMQAYLGIEPDPVHLHGNTKEARAIRQERLEKLKKYQLTK